MAYKTLKTIKSSTNQSDVYKVTIDWNDSEQIENKPEFKTVNGQSVLGSGDIEVQPKGDYLTEGNFKTINGETIVGSGDIEINASLDNEGVYTVKGLTVDNTLLKDQNSDNIVQYITKAPKYEPGEGNKMTPLRVWGQEDITRMGGVVNGQTTPFVMTGNGYLFYPKKGYTQFSGQCAWLYEVDFDKYKYAVTSMVGGSSSGVMVGLDKDLNYVGMLITNFDSIASYEPDNNYCICLGAGAQTLTKQLIDDTNFPRTIKYVIVKDNAKGVDSTSPSQNCALYAMNKTDTYHIVKDPILTAGKKFVMFGGSVAWYGTQTARGNIVWNVWDKYLKFNSFKNFAVSGAGFWTDSTKSGDGTIPLQIYNHASDIADADYAIIWASTNDAGRVVSSRGTVTDAIDITVAPNVEGSGCTTIYGGMKWCVEKLLSINPKMKIIFFTSARCQTYMNNKSYEEDLVGDQIACAKYYGSPVFDQVHEIYMNKANWWEYFDYTETDGVKTVSDGIHMNQAGYEILAPLQVKFLCNH